MKKCIAFLLAAALGIGAGLFAAAAFRIDKVTDNSMLPAYGDGDRILTSSFAFRSEDPRRGDVILFPNRIYSDSGEGALMMKRVIAIPGDKVMITDGAVYLNNRQIEEDYVFTEGISGEMAEIEIPKGRVFVLGDNRAGSTDSRSETVGLVKIDEILGKVIYKW